MASSELGTTVVILFDQASSKALDDRCSKEDFSRLHTIDGPGGWALITFNTPEEAAAAIQGMHNRMLFSSCHAPIVARIAHEKRQSSGQQQQQTGFPSNYYGPPMMLNGRYSGPPQSAEYGGSYQHFGQGGYNRGLPQQQGVPPAPVYHHHHQHPMGSAGSEHGHPHHHPGPPYPAPPPSQWITYTTPEGHPYYYNVFTKTTQWEKPHDLHGPQQSQTQAQQQQQQQQLVAPSSPRQQPSPSYHRGSASSSADEVLGARKFGPPGCNLFIFHIPSEWTHRELYQHFKFHGKIISARVKTDDSNRNMGFGFVSYETPESTLAAIKAMHGFHVGGKWLKVTLKKGEEHLLPPGFHHFYQKSARIMDSPMPFGPPQSSSDLAMADTTTPSSHHNHENRNEIATEGQPPELKDDSQREAEMADSQEDSQREAQLEDAHQGEVAEDSMAEAEGARQQQEEQSEHSEQSQRPSDEAPAVDQADGAPPSSSSPSSLMPVSEIVAEDDQQRQPSSPREKVVLPLKTQEEERESKEG